MTHFWDLSEYYLWFIRKEKKPHTFLLEYNEKFGGKS